MRIPCHLGIIMDGNGRWALARGLPRKVGHREGSKRIKTAVEMSQKWGVQYLTLYAFSTENWNRPQDEVEFLLKLPEDFRSTYGNELQKHDVRLRMMGRKNGIPASTLNAIEQMETQTKHNKGLQVIFAFNYGGKAEIVDICQSLAQEAVMKRIEPGQIDIRAIEKNLYLSDLPEVDMIIRTGGDQRLSNFLLWRAAYSELFFTNTLWPDFDEIIFDQAMKQYSTRERRFGKI